MHLDIRVTDAGRAEQELLALGAARVPAERETGFRVFTDPVGHPFCIVFGHTASLQLEALRAVAGSITRLVHGFVHKTRRDGLRRGRYRGPNMNARRQSAEVNAATRDKARRQRRTSYGS